MINPKICPKCKDNNVIYYDTESLGEYEGRFYRCRSCNTKYLEICKIILQLDLRKWREQELKA